MKNQPRNVSAASPRGDALIDLRMAGPAQGTPATINGLPAAVANTTTSGRTMRVAVMFLGNGAYAIGAQVRSAEAFNQYPGDINASIMSFHEITNQERALARPLTLRVIRAHAGLNSRPSHPSANTPRAICGSSTA